jgi:hypothetical protein
LVLQAFAQDLAATSVRAVQALTSLLRAITPLRPRQFKVAVEAVRDRLPLDLVVADPCQEASVRSGRREVQLLWRLHLMHLRANGASVFMAVQVEQPLAVYMDMARMVAAAETVEPQPLEMVEMEVEVPEQ